MPEQRNIPGTHIPEVPSELFRNKEDNSVFAQTRQRKSLKKIYDHVEYPESGGVFVYHKTFPYPEKGTKDDIMMMSIQFVKRMLMNWLSFLSYKYFLPCYVVLLFLPWRLKIKILEKFIEELWNYADMVDTLGKHFILQKKFYTAQGRELMKGLEIFLKELGVSEELADRASWLFIALIDNDTAYYYRLADILSETDGVTMLKDPQKEIMFLIKTFAEREGRPHLVAKFNLFAKALRFALWLPRVKRAFRKSVEAIDFSKLGLDEADRYHVRNMGGYNYFGMTLEERLKVWPYEKHDLVELIWK